MINNIKFDAAFVGAGITSLACAALLLKKNPNLNVLLIDKHILPGGYASHFFREKVNAIFDCSLHKLSGVENGGNLIRILKKLNIAEKIKFSKSPIFFQAYQSLKTYTLRNNPDLFKSDLKEAFPEESAGINEFFNHVELYGKNSYYQYQIMNNTYLPDIEDLQYARKYLKNKTIKDMFDILFTDKTIKNILGAPAIYVGGLVSELSYLYYLHIIYATLYKGNAYIEGTAQNLSNHLVEIINNNNGKVLTGVKVRKILINSNKAIGVSTNKGEFFSDNIFINAAPQYALDNLIEKSVDLGENIKKIKFLKSAYSTTTLYVVFDKAPEKLGLNSAESMILPDIDTHNSMFKNYGIDLTEDEVNFWVNSTIEVTNYHLLNPTGGNVICINALDLIHHWPKHKSIPYRQKKERATNILLNRLLEYFPKLKNHITYMEMATPRTYLRFTNNTDGSGYGALVTPDVTGHAFHYKFPISGIHFLSAWVAGPSYEAAFNYAEMKSMQWRN